MLVLQITFLLIEHFMHGMHKLQQMAKEPVSQMLLVGKSDGDVQRQHCQYSRKCGGVIRILITKHVETNSQ
jgi:hypothetical protein